jgi:DNA adenine methylase Dam
MELINPPMNFTGSKYKLLPQLLPHFDNTKNTLVDLFMGGGAIYSNLAPYYNNIIVNDIIEELVRIHQNLIAGDLAFIERVKSLVVSKEDKEGFLALRSSFNENKSPEKLWALILCSTNNMMRFNKKFQYNQTFGKRTWNPNTDKKVKAFLTYITPYQDQIKFRSSDFIFLIPDVQYECKDTMVYADPPYFHTKAGYNAYWSKESEDNLYQYLKLVDELGGSFMLSGVLKHDGKESQLIKNLLAEGYDLVELKFDYKKVARRKIDKKTKEIVIKNYKT